MVTAASKNTAMQCTTLLEYWNGSLGKIPAMWGRILQALPSWPASFKLFLIMKRIIPMFVKTSGYRSMSISWEAFKPIYSNLMTTTNDVNWNLAVPKKVIYFSSAKAIDTIWAIFLQFFFRLKPQFEQWVRTVSMKDMKPMKIQNHDHKWVNWVVSRTCPISVMWLKKEQKEEIETLPQCSLWL